MAKDWQSASVLSKILRLVLKVCYYILEAFYRLIFPATEKCVAGEIVLITGAGHGIGKKLAMKYASLGATVVCWDINGLNNQRTVEEISNIGASAAYAYTCDVSNREEVIRVANRVKKEVGFVSILVNNAGILSSKSFLDHKSEEMNGIIDVNLKSHFWTIQAFLPDMLAKNHGHIVAISSMAGVVGTTNLPIYSASKFAVRGLMEALKEEFRISTSVGGIKSRICFTTVLPFIVDTGMMKNPVITFPKLTPIVSPQEVADQTVRAQRRNVTEVSVPSYWLDVNCFMKILPVKVVEAVLDFLDSGSGVQD